MIQNRKEPDIFVATKEQINQMTLAEKKLMKCTTHFLNFCLVKSELACIMAINFEGDKMSDPLNQFRNKILGFIFDKYFAIIKSKFSNSNIDEFEKLVQLKNFGKLAIDCIDDMNNITKKALNDAFNHPIKLG